MELNEAAVHDARVNVKMNKIQNVDIYSNDAGRFMVDVAEEGDSIDVVFMDPPRSGSTEEFMSSVITLGPKRVVYISCGPESCPGSEIYDKARLSGNQDDPCGHVPAHSRGRDRGAPHKGGCGTSWIKLTKSRFSMSENRLRL